MVDTRGSFCELKCDTHHRREQRGENCPSFEVLGDDFVLLEMNEVHKLVCNILVVIIYFIHTDSQYIENT